MYNNGRSLPVNQGSYGCALWEHNTLNRRLLYNSRKKTLTSVVLEAGLQSGYIIFGSLVSSFCFTQFASCAFIRSLIFSIF